MTKAMVDNTLNTLEKNDQNQTILKSMTKLLVAGPMSWLVFFREAAS